MRHDLRTPINQIIGYTELVQEVSEEEGYQEITDDLNKVNTAAHNLLRRLEEGMSGLIDQPDIESIVENAEPEIKKTDLLDNDGAVEAITKQIIESAHILVVDDNEMNRDMLSRRLQRHGYKTSIAEDGYEALKMIKETSYDSILLDVMMPGISGLEVLSSIRQQFDMTRLPVIMATARDSSEDIVKALELGANDYVTKPIDFPVVLARLATHLDVKSSAEQIRILAQDLERGKQFIRSVFGRYLTDEIVDNLLDAPQGLDFGGSRRSVTVLMSDLRGFSSLSENLSPEEVVKLLNHYLASMTPIIQRHGGTIDEFIGDAILVIFGAPKSMDNHAESAVACALDMQLAMAKVNAHNQQMGLPAIEMGIGINTGPVVVGNIGSEMRSKYGVVGRSVNLAARIESYTVGGQVLISEDTACAAKAPLRLEGSVEVSPKGCTDPIRIHNVTGINGDEGQQLPDTKDDMRPLKAALEVKLAILDGVNVPNLNRSGSIQKVSPRGAEIFISDDQVPLLTNLVLELTPPLSQGRIYGKITHVGQGDNLVVMRFSSIPKEILSSLLASRRRAIF